MGSYVAGVKPNRFDPYQMRNARLSELGYRSYREYLKSDDWREIRKDILSTQPSCIMCPRRSEVVHHVKYFFDVLLGITKSRLAPLCHRCHETIEIDEAGAKRKMGTANGLLFDAARKTDQGRAWCLAFYAECKESKKYRDAEIRKQDRGIPGASAGVSGAFS